MVSEWCGGEWWVNGVGVSGVEVSGVGVSGGDSDWYLMTITIAMSPKGSVWVRPEGRLQHEPALGPPK